MAALLVVLLLLLLEDDIVVFDFLGSLSWMQSAKAVMLARSPKGMIARSSYASLAREVKLRESLVQQQEARQNKQYPHSLSSYKIKVLECVLYVLYIPVV